MTNLHRLCTSDQLFDKCIVNGRMNNEARRCSAFLAGAPKSPTQSQRDGKVEISVIHHGQRVLGPHLHLHFGKVLNGCRGDSFAHRNRTGERDGVDLGAFDQPLTNRPTRAHHEAEQALGNVLTVDDFGQGDGRGRGDVGRLPDHSVTIAQRRGDFPGRGCGREVPGADHGDDANGLAAHINFDIRAHGIGVLTNLAQAFGGIVGKELSGAEYLALAFGERLSFFTAKQSAQLFSAGHQFIADIHQHSLLTLQPVGGPFGLRYTRLIQRRFQLISTGLRVMSDHIGQIRRVAVFDFAFASQPFAGDQVQIGHNGPQVKESLMQNGLGG